MHFLAILLSGLHSNLTPENWVGNFISSESRNPENHSSFLDFRLFSRLKAQKSNPGHNFRLLASLKGKSQNRFFAFGFQAAPWGVPRLYPLVARSPPFCACTILPMTMLLQEWSQSRRSNSFKTKMLLWSPLATSRWGHTKLILCFTDLDGSFFFLKSEIKNVINMYT